MISAEEMETEQHTERSVRTRRHADLRSALLAPRPCLRGAEENTADSLVTHLYNGLYTSDLLKETGNSIRV